MVLTHTGFSSAHGWKEESARVESSDSLQTISGQDAKLHQHINNKHNNMCATSRLYEKKLIVTVITINSHSNTNSNKQQ